MKLPTSKDPDVIAIQDPVAEVLALPEGERLDYALELLKYYTPHPKNQRVEFYAQHYLLGPKAACCFVALYDRLNFTVPLETLAVLLWGPDSDVQTHNSIRVYMAHLRNKLPPQVQVANVPRYGYAMRDPESCIPEFTPESFKFSYRNTKNTVIPWTLEEDGVLITLIRMGRTVAECAIVLRRSARAVSDRHKIIRREHGLPERWN